MSFINRVKATVENTGREAVQKVKDVSEISKYTSQIEECEREIKSLFEKIGAYLYCNHTAEHEEVYGEWFRGIAANVKTVEELKEKIRILKQIEVCPKCGAELKKDANFCNECGTRIEKKPAVEVGMKTCPKCGTALKGMEKFCMTCGADLSAMQNESSEKLICKGCGKELKPGHAFCQYCGMPVEKQESSEAAVSGIENLSDSTASEIE